MPFAGHFLELVQRSCHGDSEGYEGWSGPFLLEVHRYCAPASCLGASVCSADVYCAPKVSQFFYDEGIHILTTGFPIVPLDRGAMVRISLSAAHTDAQIERLLDVFRKLRDTPYCIPQQPGRQRCPT